MIKSPDIFWNDSILCLHLTNQKNLLFIFLLKNTNKN